MMAAHAAQQSAARMGMDQALAHQQLIQMQQDAMYAMRNVYPGPIKQKRFPRSDFDKVWRMNRFVDWKREKIFERRLRHLGWTVAALIGLPLFIAVLSLVWQLAVDAVLG